MAGMLRAVESFEGFIPCALAGDAVVEPADPVEADAVLVVEAVLPLHFNKDV